jgi:hypothetical protein
LRSNVNVAAVEAGAALTLLPAAGEAGAALTRPPAAGETLPFVKTTPLAAVRGDVLTGCMGNADTTIPLLDRSVEEDSIAYGKAGNETSASHVTVCRPTLR